MPSFVARITAESPLDWSGRSGHTTGPRDAYEQALLQEAVYGLPELRRETTRSACLVANPGCYPTSIILGLKPLLDAGLIDPAPYAEI